VKVVDVKVDKNALGMTRARVKRSLKASTALERPFFSPEAKSVLPKERSIGGHFAVRGIAKSKNGSGEVALVLSIVYDDVDKNGKSAGHRVEIVMLPLPAASALATDIASALWNYDSDLYLEILTAQGADPQVLSKSGESVPMIGKVS